MISQSLLNELRSVVLVAMTAEAAVYRKTEVPDTTGGFTDTYVSVGTHQCSYAPHQITPLEQETTRGVAAISMWRFQFPSGTDIRNTDRLVADGRTFEVVSAGSGSIEVATRVLAREIE